MPELKTLTAFTDRGFYSTHFMDMHVWQPYVVEVCRRQGIGCHGVSPCFPGTFPTFRVELTGEKDQQAARCVVMKFFGPLFDGAEAFKIELGLSHWLNQQSLLIHSPGLIAHGQLECDWQYMIFEHIPGERIGQHTDRLSKDDWFTVARQMGKYLRRLHALGLPHLPEVARFNPPTWEPYRNFLQQQRLNCVAHHRDWNDLPTHLLSQLERFVLPVDQLIDFSAPPHLIHADLTVDHLLGGKVSEKWRTAAVIDWGDAMIGNLYYELIALHLDLFHADVQLLRCFLEAYGLPAFFQQDFTRKAFNVALLHQFPMPARVYAPHQDASTLQDLAERLFGV